MRGPAPSSVCPRCGAEAPPAAEPLAHCAICKLAWNPNALAVVRPARAPEVDLALDLVPAPSGLVITREPGEVSIGWSYQRLGGIGYLILGLVCLAMLVGNLDTPGERLLDMFLLGAAAVATLYIGAARMVSQSTLQIDERQLLLHHAPLPLWRSVWVGRSEVQEITVRSTGHQPSAWSVLAITPRGDVEIARFGAGNSVAEAAANCVADVVREAIEKLPAK